MKAMRFVICQVLAAGFVCSTIAFSQMHAGDGPLRPLNDSLSSQGIGSSKPDLLAALKSSSSEIRVLAAAKLAETVGSDAWPAIKGALDAETDPRTRVEFLSILLSAGDSQAGKDLEKMCVDPSLPASAVESATARLEMVGKGGACAENIIELVKSTNESNQRLDLLNLYAAMYHDATPAMATRMNNSAQLLLRDKSPAVRMLAGHVLAQGGSNSSVQFIEDARVRESDSIVRSSLEGDLKTIRAAPGHE